VRCPWILALSVPAVALVSACGGASMTSTDADATVQARVQATSQALATIILAESQQTPRPVGLATAVPTATAPARPTTAPTASLAASLDQVDRAWATQDWSTAIKALVVLHRSAPDNADYTDKLYAAYINSADTLVATGDKTQALSQLSRATDLEPDRQEARDRELALTPTPAAPPATPTPAVPTGLVQYIGRVEPLVSQSATAVQTLRGSHTVQVVLDVIAKSDAVDKIQTQMDRDRLVAQDRSVTAEQRAAALRDSRQQALNLPHAQVVALDATKNLEALDGSADQQAAAGAYAQIQQLATQLQDVRPAPSGFDALDSQVASLDDDLAYVANEYGTGIDAMSSAHIANALQRMQAIQPKAQTLLSEISDLKHQFGIGTAG